MYVTFNFLKVKLCRNFIGSFVRSQTQFLIILYISIVGLCDKAHESLTRDRISRGDSEHGQERQDQSVRDRSYIN